jgi:mono/diheme cytochrome c family protein
MRLTRSLPEILFVGVASHCSRVTGWLGGAVLLSAIWAPCVLGAAESPLPVPPDHAARMSRGLESFDREIASLLSEHCLKCHGGEKTKGDFDVSHRDSLLKGGADGPSVAAFHSEKSRLIRMLKHEEEPYMPEKKPRLSDEVIAKIVAWIDQGAPYSKALVEGKKPERDRSKVGEEDRRWWSFLPLSHPVVPKVAGLSHPVDRFLAAKGAAKGLTLAPQADKRTLIRRATLDLTGLPPTPEEVEKFVADASPEAWPRLIDELLSRPAYGERWARHWMDVARYGESSGFEQDYDRVGSYQYRDFLIQALNADMPFSQFVQWQLAGDEFAPGNPKALAATAFLSLGVFPTQVTVNELERVRYEDMDDMLSTTGAAFLGLTVGCARCHDHKYDPIPAKDYYRMLSTFTGTVRSELELDVDPEKTVEQKAAWKKAHEAIVEEQHKVEASLKPVFQKFLAEELPKLPEPVGWALWGAVQGKASAGSTLEAQRDGSFLAKAATVPDRENYEFEGAAPGLMLTGLRVEALVDKSLAGGGPGRAGKGNFHLSKVRVEVLGPDGAVKEVPFSKAEADFEQKAGGGVAGLVSGQKGAGWMVGGKEKADHALALTFAEPWMPEAGSRLRVTLEFQGQPKHSMGRPRLAWMVSEEPTLKRPTLPEGVAELILARKAPESEADLAKLERWWRTQNRSWTAVEARRVASEKAEPTGLSKVLVASESFPPIRYHTAGGSVETYKKTFVLKRGNVALKEEEATPGFLQVLSRAPEERWSWTPPQGASYAGRRRALANWILDEKEGAGALAARVFVNRLWLHHFGQGMVSTPNDFGKTGATPSQPELLDWLAGQLIESGGSVKAMHRLLMTSQAYQQAALKDATKEKADPGNELFLRRLPKRLEGEAIRDSMLAVSGLLDGQMYGPGVADERSPRRSVYLRVKRSKLIGSMVSFDQPEPLASQGVRPTTTVAPQALFLMNSLQARDCTQALAGRVLKSAGKDAPLERFISEAYGLTLSRAPLAEESSEARDFLEAQTARWVAQGESRENAFHRAIADFCQVLFQTNEFVYRP